MPNHGAIGLHKQPTLGKKLSDGKLVDDGGRGHIGAHIAVQHSGQGLPNLVQRQRSGCGRRDVGADLNRGHYRQGTPDLPRVGLRLVARRRVEEGEGCEEAARACRGIEVVEMTTFA